MAASGLADSAANSLPGSLLFDSTAVQVLRIQLAPEAVAALRQHPRKDVSALVRLGEVECRNAGLHLKGRTGSFRPIDDKPGLTLSFDKFVRGQRFCGLRKIHLNNAVEDPSCLNESLGAELFRKAGVPAPRVTRAKLELNGRSLGLYVVSEGFTEEFLSQYFKNPRGNLYDNDAGHDVDEPLDRDSGKGPNDQTDLRALAAAAREPDPGKRWERLQATLEVDRFISFMAMEIMTGHRDGYCLSRNNFRVYHNLDSGRMLLLPQGMDQLFGNPKLPLYPRPGGLLASAVLDTPEGRRQYRARLAELFTNVFVLPELLGRADRLASQIRPGLAGAEARGYEARVAEVKERIARRHAYLQQQVFEPESKPLAFVNGTAALTDWTPVDAPPGGKMERATGPGGRPALRIQAGPVTAATWRSKALLLPGQYRFEGAIRAEGIEPLPYGKNLGAGLRAGDRPRARPNSFIGTRDWQLHQVDFQVAGREREIELRCELRARGGEAWFAVDSLRLIQLASSPP